MPGMPGLSTTTTRGRTAIRFVVNTTFVLDGVINMNGVDCNAGAEGCCAGSGGSVWISAASLSGNYVMMRNKTKTLICSKGTGSITTNGGNGSLQDSPSGWVAGGGAGGRIALYGDSSFGNYVISSYGGGGVWPGAAGTIFESITNSPPAYAIWCVHAICL